jgi:outer membrane immunogenic protein
MKKLITALTVVAALTGSASAADMAGRPYSKAPAPMMAAPSWTGFYLFGGAGGGLWAADTTTQATATTNCILCSNQRQGGSGWYGTVGAGYDWEVTPTWVVGVFGDGQFGSIKGTIQDQDAFFAGEEKLRTSWAAGVRVGYLVAPNVLSYVNGGYSGSNWSGTSLVDTHTGAAVGAHTNSFDRQVFFVGGGVENNLNIFGITAPGWFMKTEYRAAYFNRATLAESFITTGVPTGSSTTFHPLVQTISTSLVYRFNWGGPVVAKY